MSTTSRTTPQDGLYAALTSRGMSRRTFLGFTAAMTAALALPAVYRPRIARAVEAAPRIPLVWLRGQDCGGDTVAFLRSAQPPVTDLLLDQLSVDYHETLMAASGSAATDALAQATKQFANGYIAVIEGSIPTAEDGAACIVGGRAFRDVAREVTAGALATIAVGACAFDGGIPAAGGGSTRAAGAGDVVSGTLISLPGCPVNVENLSATLVHYLTFGEWPATDALHRPYFAYGALIHNQCERRPYFEYGQFVQAWGDEGAQKGWCLYKMGCKGPETFANCPTVKYSSGTSWPVRAGHGCIGCHAPGFWDRMTPAYARLPSPMPIGPQLTVDQVGALLVGGVAAGTMVHGAASYVHNRRRTGRRGGQRRGCHACRRCRPRAHRGRRARRRLRARRSRARIRTCRDPRDARRRGRWRRRARGRARRSRVSPRQRPGRPPGRRRRR
jgi:hydrogenase small subunit